MNNEYVLFSIEALAHHVILQQRWRFEGVFVWFPDQVRDDNYRQPGLKEGAFTIHYSQFIIHNA